MSALKNIFTPIKIHTLELPNRIVMSPMVTHFATDNGTVTQRMIDYYAERAAGGVGLITVEAAFVDLKSMEHHMLGSYDDKLIPGLRALADAIHAAGGKACLQILHKGRLAKSSTTDARTVSASAVPDMGTDVPRELLLSEIPQVVDRFAQAARRTKEAGFDAVELHMAHGYLINQFLSPYSNKRTDAYGGTMEKRARFAVEVVEAVRKTVGPDYPIFAKINSTEHVEGGIQVEDWKTFLPMLEKAGLNAVVVTGGVLETNQYITPPAPVKRGINVDCARQIKQFSNLPVGVVGRIPDIDQAEQILEAGDADMIYMGRATVADPEIVNKAKEGRLADIRPCIVCSQGCSDRVVFREADMRCLVNPCAGREGQIKITKAEQPKDVLVIGGGPAGLTAAATAAKRGHRVTLFDANRYLGGQFYLAGIPPLKWEIPRFIKYLEHDARQSGVEIILNHKVTPETIMTAKPDVVIHANGSVPFTLPVPGAERCIYAGDVLLEKVKVTGPCVVIGGGSVGCETADFLTERGVQVTIMEMAPALCPELEKRTRRLQLAKLVHAGVQMLTNAKVLQIGEDFVEYDSLGLTERVSNVKEVIMAAGYRGSVQKDLEDTCKLLGIDSYSVGDCNRARTALTAVREGFDCALKL